MGELDARWVLYKRYGRSWQLYARDFCLTGKDSNVLPQGPCLDADLETLGYLGSDRFERQGRARDSLIDRHDAEAHVESRQGQSRKAERQLQS
jgi:hypothetical protein